jgi:hypothetical protein
MNFNTVKLNDRNNNLKPHQQIDDESAHVLNRKKIKLETHKNDECIKTYNNESNHKSIESTCSSTVSNVIG